MLTNNFDKNLVSKLQTKIGLENNGIQFIIFKVNMLNSFF